MKLTQKSSTVHTATNKTAAEQNHSEHWNKNVNNINSNMTTNTAYEKICGIPIITRQILRRILAVPKTENAAYSGRHLYKQFTINNKHKNTQFSSVYTAL